MAKNMPPREIWGQAVSLGNLYFRPSEIDFDALREVKIAFLAFFLQLANNLGVCGGGGDPLSSRLNPGHRTVLI